MASLTATKNCLDLLIQDRLFSSESQVLLRKVFDFGNILKIILFFAFQKVNINNINSVSEVNMVMKIL